MPEIEPACPSCGTTTDNEPSCCARGGTWFQKCGSKDDPDTEHTWNEGIEACKPRTVRGNIFDEIVVDRH